MSGLFIFVQMRTLYEHYLNSSGICTDTRKIKKGSLFVALKGANFDGNDYVLQALSEGASFALSDRNSEAHRNSSKVILVEDCLKSLQALANYHRKQLATPIIGITGSNGKTSTKELLHASLSTRFKTFATPGNFNNHIGVPLTLLQLTKEHEFGVLEFGDNHIGEIAELCEIAEPDYCYLTNIGKDHLEGFGSFENNVKAKKELYDYALKREIPVFIDKNEGSLMNLGASLPKKILYPNEESLQFGLDGAFIKILYGGKSYVSHLVGEYNRANIEAAFYIATHLGAKADEVLKAIAAYQPQNNRSQLIEKATNSIYLDAYNANPSSMQLAIESFRNFNLRKHKVVVLGDMLELGESSRAEHQAIFNLAKASKFDLILLVGNEFGKIRFAEGAKHYSNVHALKDALKQKPLRDSQILLKGSRGIRLEELLEVL